MGKFVAFDTETSAQQNEIGTTVADYYRWVIRKTGLTLHPAVVDTRLDASVIDGMHIDGTVLELMGRVEVKTVAALLSLMSDVENNLFYKWQENNGAAVEWVEETNVPLNVGDNKEILNGLSRVTAEIYNAIFTSSMRSTLLMKHNLPGQLESNSNSTLISPVRMLPILVVRDVPKSAETVSIYTNSEAYPFFIDSSDKTSPFKFEKSGGKYAPVKTFAYSDTVLNKRGGLKNNQAAVSDYKDGFKRKLYGKIRFIDKNYRRVAGLSHWSATKENRQLLYNGLETEATMTADIEAAFNGISTEGDLKKTTIAEAEKYATRHSNLIPSRFRCFYYADRSNHLRGILSSVKIGVGGRGGGYAMRCDPSTEVTYRWAVTPYPDHKLAIILGLIMGLRPPGGERYLSNKVQVGDLFATNWPYDKNQLTLGDDRSQPANKKKNVTGMDLGIRYYQHINSVGKTRNRPRSPIRPRSPQLTNPAIPGVQNWKTRFKLDSSSSRIWKKGAATEGDIPSKRSWSGEKQLGNVSSRQDAGSVMADALGLFDCFDTMISHSRNRVSRAKLSATDFAKYMLSNTRNDGALKNQWAIDKPPANGATIDENSLKTDQEWCHLFGHGDGGKEQLGNFVCGSKHCNTEQLAIETGLRRVTQSTAFSAAEKKKIRTKITAYLYPNAGTWMTGEFDAKEVTKLFKKVDTDESDMLVDDANNWFWRDEFFVKGQNEDGSPKFTLKHIDELIIAERKLTAAIKNKEANGSDLINLRRDIREKCFMYLPLARWMRYKIYYGENKIFDHIYNAQSESFDIHECKILDYSIEHALCTAVATANGKTQAGGKRNGEDEYRDRIQSRMNKFQLSDDVKAVFDQLLNAITACTDITREGIQIEVHAHQHLVGLDDNPNLSTPQIQALNAMIVNIREFITRSAGYNLKVQIFQAEIKRLRDLGKLNDHPIIKNADSIIKKVSTDQLQLNVTNLQSKLLTSNRAEKKAALMRVRDEAIGISQAANAVAVAAGSGGGLDIHAEKKLRTEGAFNEASSALAAHEMATDENDTEMVDQ